MLGAETAADHSTAEQAWQRISACSVTADTSSVRVCVCVLSVEAAGALRQCWVLTLSHKSANDSTKQIVMGTSTLQHCGTDTVCMGQYAEAQDVLGNRRC